MRGLRLGFGVGVGGGPAPNFSPTALFSANEEGGWYDIDPAYMFQDSAGTSPVTATGQTVGLVLDRSKGLVLGPELVTNGDFSNGSTGWTVGSNITVSSGVAVFNVPAFGASGISQSGVITSGKWYKITVDVSNYTSGFLQAEIPGAFSFGVFTSGNGTKTLIGRAGASGAINLRAQPNGDIANFTIDNISVKELPGNHLSQPTLANRPIYGIEPFGGRRNLLTFTEQFDNAVWIVKVGLVTDVTDAFGGNSACTVTSSAPNQLVLRHGSPGNTAGLTYVNSVYLRRRTGTGTIIFNTPGNSQIDVTSQVSSSWSRVQLSSVAAGSGYFVVSLGTSGDSIDVCFPQSELGSTATAYQRVTDQWNVTQAGVQSVGYLQYDGSDDWFVSPTITPGIDKAQVFAGVRKLSDAAFAVLLETSTDSSTNNGAIGLFAPNGASGEYSFRSRGTIMSNAIEAPASNLSPKTNVITGIGDIGADVTRLRVNGSQVAADTTTDQGTGNYLAYPLYVGRRAGTGNAYNGRIYSLIVRFGANLTADQIAQTENYVNSKTGAY